GQREQHQVWITPSGVGSRTPNVGEVKYEWGFAQQINGTPHDILLHWKSGFTTVIPKCAFSDAAAAERFVRTARHWHVEATRPRRATGSEIAPSHQPAIDEPQEGGERELVQGPEESTPVARAGPGSLAECRACSAVGAQSRSATSASRR